MKKHPYTSGRFTMPKLPEFKTPEASLQALLLLLASQGHTADVQLTLDGKTVITCESLPSFRATFNAPEREE